MFCQVCGAAAPTQYVALHQNIGLLVMRFYQGVEGNLCKSCINSYFWSYTGVNMLLGWWGMISLIITPFFLINNTYYYLSALGLESPPDGGKPMTLTEQDVQLISPHVDQIIARINAGENIQQVCEAIGQKAGVPGGKVFLFMKAIADQQG
jgi:hypothetical protein